MQAFRNKWTALFLSNFLGVFNDNFLKNCIIFIAVAWNKPTWMTQSQLISLVSASLIVPYLLLSPVAGHLAVNNSKKKIFRLFKLLEIPVLLVACIAFYLHWVMLAIFTVLVMGILSCLYSPSKYSLIRDIGGAEGVSFGSGIFEMMAFLGILIGTVCASFVSDAYNQWIVFSVLIGLALLGYFVTTTISATELPEKTEHSVTLNPVQFIIRSFRFARQYAFVNDAVFGASAFWLIGAMLQMNLVIHTEHVYHASNSITGLIMATAAIGIALGTGAAAKFSGQEVKKGLILIGIFGMSIFIAILTFFKLNFGFYFLIVFSTAFMGGLFQIPCLSMLQQANLGRKLGDMVAYLNLVTFVFVFVGTVLFSATTHICSDNSFMVFAVMLVLSLCTGLYFLLTSADYWRATKAMFQKMNKLH